MLRQFGEYGSEAYAHPIKLIIAVALCMPLLSNLMAVQVVLLWRMMRRNWLDTKQLWRTR